MLSELMQMKGEAKKMAESKDCIAMLLAGGEGRRLGNLTRHLAKPAIPFGGRYRIIDFTLSNCSNSGIDTVGVLTQYQPQVLNSHMGNGSSWDLDLTILPPFTNEEGVNSYKGTANAVYQNTRFIEKHLPRNVLVTSGDHIYKMDYSRLLNYHEAKGAEVTIAVIQVPWREAGRFGVMHTAEDGRIVEFQEKPQKPRSNLASMGVYLFSRELLEKYLRIDEENPDSSNDFGKDVIPLMLKEGCRMFAYPFQGYWRDIGTIESLWHANMDLLTDEPPLDLNDPSWQIYSVSSNLPPYYLAPTARAENSLISKGCMVFGEIYNSILSANVYVGEGTVIKDSVIMPGVKIGKDTYIKRAIINENTAILNDCHTGVCYQVSDTNKNPIEIVCLEKNIAVPLSPLS